MKNLRTELGCCIAFVISTTAAAGESDARVDPSTGSTSSPVNQTSLSIAPADQATRDAERVRILEDELTQLQLRLEDAIKRYSERLAAHDAPGANEAAESRTRVQADIAALHRELETARSAPPLVTARKGRVTPPATISTAAWWDVYAKASGRPAIDAPFGGR